MIWKSILPPSALHPSHLLSCIVRMSEHVRDITRYVKYPRYIRVQRLKALLQNRMKVPPTVNIFRCPVTKNLNNELLSFAQKYATETSEVRKARIAKNAQDKTDIKAPLCVATGVNCVTSAIEHQRAQLVLIANDVDPLEVCLS